MYNSAIGRYHLLQYNIHNMIASARYLVQINIVTKYN